MIRIVQLCIDAREAYREYDKPEPYFGTAPAALLEGFAGLEGAEVHVVCCLQAPAPAPDRLAPNVRYHALLVPRRGWLRTGYQGCIRAVRRRLAELNPDIVHGQGTERECGMTAVYSGFPNVLTLHGNMRAVARAQGARPFSFNWMAARMEGWVLPRTLGVFCNSAYTEEQVRPLARRVWRVPNPVQTRFFAERTAPRDQPPVLLNVGGVVPHKGQVELLEMAGWLHARGLKFVMEFAGHMNEQSTYGERFRALLDKAADAGYARHAGFREPSGVRELMDRATALVHTPFEESFGLVVTEALARDLKVFAFRTGGVGETTREVPGVELVAPGDWQGMGAALGDWLRSGCPAQEASGAIMRERYHPRVIAQRHVEIYREVLGSV